ncbi:hypothetical protein ID850_17960 [Xenorhabdus sp. Flor]|uniref:hypothetical protein n=1 Tax=Xenorhabdus cabanillasii TaxID=351673 RepID=UPI0019AAC4A2|nr:hypothetical protein [Xenorhabdus sp. Flor]
MITLAQLATYPLITYRYGITGRSQIDKALHNAPLNPDVVLSAQDSEPGLISKFNRGQHSLPRRINKSIFLIDRNIRYDYKTLS